MTKLNLTLITGSIMLLKKNDESLLKPFEKVDFQGLDGSILMADGDLERALVAFNELINNRPTSAIKNERFVTITDRVSNGSLKIDLVL
jgi:hypothetical protein